VNFERVPLKRCLLAFEFFLVFSSQLEKIDQFKNKHIDLTIDLHSIEQKTTDNVLPYFTTCYFTIVTKLSIIFLSDNLPSVYSRFHKRTFRYAN